MGHSVITFTPRGVGRRSSISQNMQIGEGGAHVSYNVCLQVIERLIQTFKKKEEHRNGQEL